MMADARSAPCLLRASMTSCALGRRRRPESSAVPRGAFAKRPSDELVRAASTPSLRLICRKYSPPVLPSSSGSSCTQSPEYTAMRSPLRIGLAPLATKSPMPAPRMVDRETASRCSRRM